MDAFVDLRWVERAAGRLCLLDALLSPYDAFQIARGLALQPAWQVSDPDAVVDLNFLRESAQEAIEPPLAVEATR
jgi:hypothetical protein